MVLMLLIFCLLLLPSHCLLGFCVRPLFCYAVLFFLGSQSSPGVEKAACFTVLVNVMFRLRFFASVP